MNYYNNEKIQRISTTNKHDQNKFKICEQFLFENEYG